MSLSVVAPMQKRKGHKSEVRTHSTVQIGVEDVHELWAEALAHKFFHSAESVQVEHDARNARQHSAEHRYTHQKEERKHNFLMLWDIVTVADCCELCKGPIPAH